MATRPTIPYFPYQDDSLTNLQNMSAAAAFAGQCPVIWHLYKTASQAITASTSTQVTFGTAAIDTDGVKSGGGAVIVTPGFYDVEATVGWQNAATQASVLLYFTLTAGTANPLPTGTVIPFGNLGDLADAVAADDSVFTTAATTPMCYPGDAIAVMFFCSQAVTLSIAFNESGVPNDLGGVPDGGPIFTGMLVSEGP